MEHWSTQYLDLPWLEKGRTRAGIDCWGLVRLVLGEQCGADLPAFDEAYLTTHERAQIEAAIAGEVVELATRIDLAAAREFDVLELLDHGRPTHLGIVVSSRRMLHIPRGGFSEMPRWDNGEWAGKVVGAWRWIGLQA
jgi:cell wall-associated NlpC family hydrolase